MLKKFLIFIAAINVIVNIKAESTSDSEEIIRPVTSSYIFGMGGSELADTYLTPIIYHGWEGSFQYSRLQAMGFSPDKWVMNLSLRPSIARGLNKVGNATMWQAMLEADWAMMRRWRPTKQWTLGLGGFTGIDVGVLYHQRNGNNPVAAKGSWTIGLKAYLTYGFKLGKVKMLARWQGMLPITGVFFSPDYGELYYEIYLGNHSGLFHGAWWGNYFRVNNDVSLDINCGTNWLRIGYSSHVLSTKVNDITSRIISNSFVIGFVGEWLWVSPHMSASDKARIVSALY